jgi:amino acid adenylation domain-containing protein
MPTASTDRYPLTPLQQGLVYHSLMAPDAGLYIQQFEVRLPEAVDVEALQAAWARVSEWCGVLRSRFQSQGAEGFVQHIDPNVAPEWLLEDWSSLPADTLEQHWQAWLTLDRRRGFDFNRGPLVRLALLRLGGDQYRLVWTFHHALLDGRSHLMLLREALNCYDASLQGRKYEFPPTAPYAEFVAWLLRRDHQASQSFWRQHLAGFESPLQLALALPSERPQGYAEERGRVGCSLDPEQTRRLRDFAAAEQLTLGTLVIGAWAVVLSRYSASEDLVFGATRACRHGSVDGAQGMLGLLINTLPLRIRLDAPTPLLDWLRGIREQWLALRPHEHTPLALVQDWGGFGAERPLFDTLLAYEDSAYQEQLRAQGGAWARREFELHESGNYPLVAAGQGGSRLHLRIAYSRARLADASVQTMLEQWCEMLLGLSALRERPVTELPLLRPSEYELVVRQWNATAQEPAQALCLHQLFEAQVARTPAAPAILVEPEPLSYAELNRRANRLARFLCQAGAGPEVHVALCLARGPELIVALLAVLKSGAAYVPLDPGQPDARLLAMLEESQAALLLTESAQRQRFAALAITVLCPDAAAASLAGHADTNLHSGVMPANLAYAIYTSGSTGAPKLIGVEHRSVVNFIHYTTQVVFRREDLAVVPFADAITFDPSVYRLFTVLTAGGSLILLSSLFDLPDSRWVAQLTSLGGAPSVLHSLLEGFVMPASLRMVSFGAEMPGEALLERLQQTPQLERLYNFYGPTEATISCAGSLLAERSPAQAGGRPAPMRRLAAPSVIGRPFWNVRMHILDARLRPVPIGVSGEICVAGLGVSRGYLNHPELSAERFVADPFCADADARLYKTGDLGRYLADGRIEFIGRCDHQVKQHGLRIELGEIETHLDQHPQLGRCVVVQREDSPGRPRLIAYAEPRAGAAPSAEELRAWLQQRLPVYMVPSGFVLLDRLPLTANGKLDRHALPPPAPIAGEAGGGAVAPRTPLELHLVKIWEDILGTRPIGVGDDFFELGGHSLLAVALLERIERHFGTKLPLDTLWSGAANIAALAALLAEDAERVEWPELVEIKRGGERRPVFFAHTSGGNLFHYYPLAGALAADQPVYGLQARGIYGSRAPRDSVEAIAADCIAAMRTRQPSGPYRIGGFSSGGIIAYEMAQQLRGQGERVACLVLLDTYGPDVVQREPLWASLRALLSADGLRLAQERLYHRCLRTFGLRRLRRLCGIGESQRWAHWSYRPHPYAGPIDLFIAADSAQASADPELGWRRMAGAGLRRHPLAAEAHGLIVKPPVVSELAAQLQAVLDRSDSDARA